ncbi:anaphase-promoting complex subunit Cut9 [Dispira parvispora]|uniref:Anaphase-promoting complex subunit Cut9 n=1 Tax=Dispira parvispora TaxID=1520584 RepID=A0A9W8ARW2_9FUNG|nr:anaphase-promoting complex subunit Cut9 [Dispira parvispora]
MNTPTAATPLSFGYSPLALPQATASPGSSVFGTPNSTHFRSLLTSLSPFRFSTVPGVHPTRSSVSTASGPAPYPPTLLDSQPVKAENPDLPVHLLPLVEELRNWRRYAMDGLLWDTAAYWGEKVLSMTQQVQDLYALGYIHLAAGHLHRAEYLLLLHPRYLTYTHQSWACRYLAALTAIRLGKYAEALWVLGEQPPTQGSQVSISSTKRNSARRFSTAAKDSRTSIGGSVDRRPVWQGVSRAHRPLSGRDSIGLPVNNSRPRTSVGSAAASPFGNIFPNGSLGMHQPNPSNNTRGTGNPREEPLSFSPFSGMANRFRPDLSPLPLDRKEQSPFSGPFPSMTPQETPTRWPGGVPTTPWTGSRASNFTNQSDTSTVQHTPLVDAPTEPRRVSFAPGMATGLSSDTDHITSPTLDNKATSSGWPPSTGVSSLVAAEPDTVGMHFGATVHYLRGLAYLHQQSLMRARHCLKEALVTDVRCFDAFQLLLDHHLLGPAELVQFVGNLPITQQLGPLAGQLVRELYATKLGAMGVEPAAEETESMTQETPAESSKTECARSKVEDLATTPTIPDGMESPLTGSSTLSASSSHNTFTQSLNTLVTKFRLRDNPDLWTAAAQRAYSAGQLHHCFAMTSTVLSTDPYHLATLPWHIACLFALRMKHPLYYLAHDLVDYFHHHVHAKAGATIAATVGSLPGPQKPTGQPPTDTHNLWYGGASSVRGTLGDTNLAQGAGSHDNVAQSGVDAKHPIPWFAVGCYYLLTGQHDASRRYFSRACSLDPQFGPAWVGFAHAFAAEGEHEPAVTAYSTASRLFPGSHFLPLFLGTQYLQMQSLALAEEFLEQAVDMLANRGGSVRQGLVSVTSTLPRTAKGNSLQDPLAKPKQAPTWLSSVPRTLSLVERLHCAPLLNELGVLAYQRERYDVAQVFLQRAEAVLVNPNTSPHTTLAALQGTLSTGDPTTESVRIPAPLGGGAIPPAEASDLVSVWRNLGHTYRRLRDYNQAVAYFEKVQSVCPHDADTLTSLGLVCHIRGQVAEAIVLYHQALASHPNNPMANTMLPLALDHSHCQSGLPSILKPSASTTAMHCPTISLAVSSTVASTVAGLGLPLSDEVPDDQPSDTDMDIEEDA